MKAFSLSLIVLMLSGLLLVSCTKQEQKAPPKPEVVQPDVWTCSMHPQVVQDKPGTCPICGMALIKKVKAAAADTPEMERLRRVSLSPTQRVMANVATVTIGRGATGGLVHAVGIVDASEPLVTTVTARFSGRLEKLYVNFTGQHVSKGDPLFDLYSPELATAVEELRLAARANADSANTIDASPAQMLNASRDRLRNRFGLTAEQIQKLEPTSGGSASVMFRSPGSGTVTVKDVQKGQFVSEGTTLYELTDLSNVWIALDVYEQDIARVKLHQSVDIRSDANQQDMFTGTVAFIDPVINAESRTARVRIDVSNRDGRLKPNMYVDAQIHVQSGTGLRIPADAVLYTGKRNIVWVEVAANTFEPRDVHVGETTDGTTEILGGLLGNETIVATGGYLIESESQLTAIANSR